MSLSPTKVEALASIPRTEFVASPDLASSISGHSIPPEPLVRHLLKILPPFSREQVVMHIGGGAGYLAAVLSRLVAQVVYVERQAAIAEAATRRFEKLSLDNIAVRIDDARPGFDPGQTFDVILATTFLEDWDFLIPCLAEGGVLYALEGREGPVPGLVMLRRNRERLVRQRTLGWLDFARTTEQILMDMGVIDRKALKMAKAQAASGNRRLLDVLHGQLHLEDRELYANLARQRGIPFVEADLVMNQLDHRLFGRFSRTFLDLSRLIPLWTDADGLVVATDDPDARKEQLERMSGDQAVRVVLVTPTDYRRLWTTLDLSEKGSRFASEHAGSGSRSESRDAVLGDGQEAGHISPYLVSIYESILLEAASEKASDIHIEQYGDQVRLRLRVDGELHDLNQYQLSDRELKGLINVIKLRAELNIAEHRLPQGGRSRLRLADQEYDLRVQTQPSLHGEHVVIRLLPQTGRAMTIAELGMSARIGAHYERLLANPSGLVLVVGPTGSGKSTTLYAGLQTLADDGRRKVITVEDPIEYSIDRVQQTRVRSEIGFGFSDAMRSFVRQDPDVIMVGEIRDQETALEAIRASQTGHVVLSTLHCNDAVDALQRLYDLGIHPNSIAGELMAVIAQRLAKRICEQCRQPADADPAILAELFPTGTPDNFHCFEGKGCAACNGRGTRGRVAVIEYLEVDADIRNAISGQPPIGEMRWRALDGGLVTMRDSALDHVIEGRIPLSELPRILPRERMAPEVRGGRRQTQ